jgi:uncharacterized protein HemX
MFLALLQPVAQVPAEVAAKAGTTLIESGILGTLLVVSVLGNAALIWLALRTMNKRVEDGKALHALSEKMVTTFASMETAVEDLNDADKAQTMALQSMKSTLDTLLMSMAVRGVPNNHPPGKVR